MFSRGQVLWESLFIFFDHLPVWASTVPDLCIHPRWQAFAVSTLPSLSESPGFPCVLSWKKQMLYLDYLFSWGPGSPFRKIIVFHGTLKKKQRKIMGSIQRSFIYSPTVKSIILFLMFLKFHSDYCFLARMSYFIFRAHVLDLLSFLNSSFSDSSHLPCWVPVPKSFFGNLLIF